MWFKDEVRGGTDPEVISLQETIHTTDIFTGGWDFVLNSGIFILVNIILTCRKTPR